TKKSTCFFICPKIFRLLITYKDSENSGYYSRPASALKVLRFFKKISLRRAELPTTFAAQT
ncbi:MAG: hypothetical protein K2L03_08515, partial [Bacteroidales bacterium]|nr:hypothetical protein [Bacteroidales bacterium]